ncbi:MAG: InlB B-repeat-containing protein, partial [Clostridiales bacterium]|nr:InlB B-repeat-containing protein [Clostridiales bacterium]
GGTISECEALTDNGGGLYADNSTINISGGTISGCKGVWGGGLYAENSSTIEISDGTISGCTVGAGGGLFVDRSTVRISGGIISGCITSDTGNGGGLYANHSTLKITGGRIENNKAAHGGGVALVGKTTFEKPITNWTVIGNEAYATGGVGGGIKFENGSMDVSAGSNRIYNNTAGGQGADIFLLNDSSTIKLPNAANMNATYRDSGIEIDGWYNDNPPYTPSENGVGVDVSGELTGGLSLVASYKTILVRIEIDANGGVGGSGSQTVEKGKTVTLEAPTKEGHLFTGWKDEKGNSYPAGADGKVNITVNEDMKLTAVWEARTFTVTYVLLDGKTRTETVAYGQKLTLGEEPRTGYTFVGWKDGEKMYHAGETITVTEDKTLTAVWDTRSFTVTYVLLNGKTRTETAAYGQNVTLGEEPRTGYTFVGWKDGEKMYHAGETITVTEDMTLTAEWEKLPSAENLPKTGDESPVLLWSAVLVVSAAAGFMLKRKK